MGGIDEVCEGARFCAGAGPYLREKSEKLPREA